MEFFFYFFSSKMQLNSCPSQSPNILSSLKHHHFIKTDASFLILFYWLLRNETKKECNTILYCWNTVDYRRCLVDCVKPTLNVETPLFKTCNWFIHKICVVSQIIIIEKLIFFICCQAIGLHLQLVPSSTGNRHSGISINV